MSPLSICARPHYRIGPGRKTRKRGEATYLRPNGRPNPRSGLDGFALSAAEVLSLVKPAIFSVHQFRCYAAIVS